MGSSKPQTVGYHYKWDMHHGWCVSLDALLAIRAGGVDAWTGRVSENTSLLIRRAELWGGEKGEGGMVGVMDVLFGNMDQEKHPYLLSRFGPKQSANRGAFTTLWKGGRFGAFIPNPKTIEVKGERILTDWADDEPWYPERAAVSLVPPGALAIYIALDASGSMNELTENGKSRLENAKAALDVTLESLAQNFIAGAASVDIAIVLWGNEPDGRSTQILRNANEGSIAALRQWLEGVGAMFGTYFPAAFVDFEPFFASVPAGSRRIAFFVTDGEPTPGAGLDEEGVARAARALVDQVPGVNVYGINIDLADTTYTRIVDNASSGGVPVVRGGDPSALTGALMGAMSGVRGMNPAHMIYDAITHADMLGEPRAQINEASFTAAANVAYGEAFGLCTQYDSDQETPEQFIQRICNVWGAACSQSRVDGQYYLDPIRGGYDVDSLPVITDADIIEFELEPIPPTEQVNCVRAEWFDQQVKDKRTTSPVYNLASVRSVGEVIEDTKQYPELASETLALRVASRDLASSSRPLSRLNLTLIKRMRGVRIGQPLRLMAPKHGVADMVIRAGTIRPGTHTDGRFRLAALQDVFGLPQATHVRPSPGDWVPVDPTPVPSPHQTAFEAPYIELVTTMPAAELQALAPDASFLMTAASPAPRGRNYDLATAAEGEELEVRATADWCPSAQVAHSADTGERLVAISGGALLDRVTAGSWALWGSEIIRIDAIDVNADSLVIGRGCADTVSQPHAAGSRILFCGDWIGSDGREYVEGDQLSVALLTRTASDLLEPSKAPMIGVAVTGRQARPYPPADVRLNGVRRNPAVSSDLQFTWKHRDRVLQSDQLVDQEQQSVGPEPGTTYTVRLVSSSTGAVVYEAADISGDSSIVSIADVQSSRVIANVFSTRDGIDSFQSTVWQVDIIFNPLDFVFPDGSYTPPAGDGLDFVF